MGSNKALFYVLVAFALFLAIQNLLLFYYIDRLTKTTATANVPYAAAEMGVCINNPPSITGVCDLTTSEHVAYSCQINASDPDSTPLTFYNFWLTNVSLFNISSTGLIDFTPNSSHSGNHTFILNVSDNTGCTNEMVWNVYNFQVLNVNDPPYLIRPIPNQTWKEDTQITPFDLDLYFADPDGDPLNYTKTITNFVVVTINSKNEVTFAPIPGWYGVDTITFLAWDPYGENATSNSVVLTVEPVIEEETPEQPSGASGGPRTSAYSGCLPEWYCKQWGPCTPDGVQHRECFDMRDCNSTLFLPNTTQACNFISTCYDGFKGPDEEDVDCGGVCPPCASCYDGIQNQDETGVDCGGVCTPCYLNATCFDGIQNQDETGIDCGGPCPACTRQEVPGGLPEVIKKGLAPLLYIIPFLLLLLVIFVILYKKTSLKDKIFIPFLHEKKTVSLEEEKKMSILERIAKLESKLKRGAIPDLLKELSLLCIDFFMDLFKQETQYTFEEIIKFLRMHKFEPALKKVLIAYFTKINALLYNPSKVTKTNIKTLLHELKEIVLLTTVPAEEVPQTDTSALVQKMVDEFLVEIHKANSFLLKGDPESAVKIYNKLLVDYANLDDEAKTRVAQFLNLLHNDIESYREKV